MSHRLVWLVGFGACGALGCSDPVPGASAAGLNVSIGTCPTQGMSSAMIGNPAPSRFSGHGKPVYSGESGVEVSCSVRGSKTYTLQGAISQPPGLSFHVDGSVDASDGRGTGKIRMYTPGIGTHVEQGDCSLQVVDTDKGLQVERGAIWASFICGRLTAPPALTCNASGEFLFEHCTD